jgi:hypothetical protein
MHRYSELPWRNPLETNNTKRQLSLYRSHASTKDFCILFFSSFPYNKVYENQECAYDKHIYTLMILPQVHLRKPCYDF